MFISEIVGAGFLEGSEERRANSSRSSAGVCKYSCNRSAISIWAGESGTYPECELRDSKQEA